MLHIINGIIPLLIIYLFIKKYNTEYLGKYFYYLSIISIINLFIDFGFNISALKDLTEKNNLLNSSFKLSPFFSSINYAKIILSLLSLIVIYIFQQFNLISFADVSFLNIISIAIFSSLLNFTWIFYFLNESQFYSIILFFFRAISIVFIFYFNFSVFESLIITFLPVMLANILILLTISKRNHIGLRSSLMPDRLSILQRFISGYKYFLNTLLVSFAAAFWPILFSKYTTFSQIAVFGIMDKCTKGLVSLVSPLPNFLLAKKNPVSSFFHFIKKHKYLFLVISFMIILLPFLFISLPSTFLIYVLNADILLEKDILYVYSFHFILSIINTVLITFIIFYKKENVYSFLFIICYVFWILFGLVFSNYMIFMPIIIDASFMSLVVFYLIKNKYVDIGNYRML